MAKIGSTIEVLSQELEMQERDFEAWLKFEDFDPDELIQNNVIPSRHMYVEQ